MPAGFEVKRTSNRDVDGVPALVMVGSVAVKGAVDLDDRWIGPALYQQRSRRVRVCVAIAVRWSLRRC